MSATCGAGPSGMGCRGGWRGQAGPRLCAGAGAACVATGGAAGSRSGVTTVEGAKPEGKVVSRGGSAENAGGAARNAARRIAVKRAKGEGKSGDSGSPAAEGRTACCPSDYMWWPRPSGISATSPPARWRPWPPATWSPPRTRASRSPSSPHFGIGARVIALHEHNERTAAEGIVALLREGKSVALASDAGTPAVSDPGALLVDRVRAEGFPVFPIPGPSALTAALSASGIAADGVLFAGFLPSKGAERKRRLAELAAGPLGHRALRIPASHRGHPRATCTPRSASATSSSAASSPRCSRPSRACRSRRRSTG